MNKETLQNYNERLNANNTSLDNAIQLINNLPEVSGTIEITTNGTVDVTAYKTANVDVQIPKPTKGFTIEQWDTDGNPLEMTIIGMKEIPAYYLHNSQNTTFKKIKKINLPVNVTKINNYAFYQCSNLTSINLPDTITTIGGYAFQNCSSLDLEKLPESLTMISSYTFDGTNLSSLKTLPDKTIQVSNYSMSYSKLKQLSMLNVKTIQGGSQYAAPFYDCNNLKALWIGSAIYTSSTLGLSAHSFSGTSALKKIFIDVPRSVIESNTNYSKAFSNGLHSTNIIICNDDVGFITKEEFDATDWSSL